MRFVSFDFLHTRETCWSCVVHGAFRIFPYQRARTPLPRARKHQGADEFQRARTHTIWRARNFALRERASIERATFVCLGVKHVPLVYWTAVLQTRLSLQRSGTRGMSAIEHASAVQPRSLRKSRATDVTVSSKALTKARLRDSPHVDTASLCPAIHMPRCSIPALTQRYPPTWTQDTALRSTTHSEQHTK